MSSSGTRWECPRCHDRVIGPTKPRVDNICRYCLACSGRTGKMVKRVSLRLEKERAVRREAAKIGHVRRKQKERERFMVAGIDAEKLAHKLAVLPVYGGRKGWPYHRFHSKGSLKMKVVVHRLKNDARSKLGHYSADGIHLFVDPRWTELTLREVILHELMHCAWKHEWCKCKIKHCRHFHKKMRTAWAQAERKLGPVGTTEGVLGRWARSRQGIGVDDRAEEGAEFNRRMAATATIEQDGAVVNTERTTPA